MRRPRCSSELAAALLGRRSPRCACTCPTARVGSRSPCTRRATSRRPRSSPRPRRPCSSASTRSTAASSSAARPRPRTPPSRRPPSCSPSCGTQPARELAKGGLALPDSKRLAEVERHRARRARPACFHRADEAGLVVRDGRVLARVRPRRRVDAASRGRAAGGAWPQCWRDRIPATLRELVARRSETLTATDLRDDVRWFYPAGGALDRRAASTGCVGDAEALGLAVAGRARRDRAASCSPATSTGPPRDAGRALPARRSTRSTCSTTSRSSSPGPLEPAARRAAARLRRRRGPRPRLDATASARHPSTAPSRPARSADVDPRVPRRALAHRHPAAARVPGRRGRRAVRRRCASRAADEVGCPARAAIRSDDEQLVRTLAVDQSLASIGLRQTGPAPPAVAVHRRRRVLGALRRALPRRRRGRATARSSGCAGTGSRRRRRRRRRPTRSPRCSTACSRAGDEGATEQAWLARQLEAAARAKETLTVTVRMPGGQTADYLLAPASVANGRLRARDRKADIERTLPLSAIAAVSPRPRTSERDRAMPATAAVLPRSRA